MDTTEAAKRVMIPRDADFIGNFLEARELEDVADELISRWPELRWLSGHTLRIVWKRKGGTSSGNIALGKTGPATGLIGYFSKADWVMWIAADHAREQKLTAFQIEALVYHEMLHCAVEGEDEKPSARGHDAELFTDEIRRYGAWRENLQRAAAVFQAPLPGFGLDRETGELVGAASRG